MYAPIDAALWSRNLPREHGFEPLAIEGRIPPDLRGTLFRNGPALFELFGRAVAHPFDGDGAVSAFRIDDRGAAGAVRVTDSAGLRAERAAGRRLFGDRIGWLRRLRNTRRGVEKNTANTSVVVWQGRLLALMEGARPTEIDPHDLRTLGETDLGGTVGAMFSAHPHRVAARRTTYNFGLEYGPTTRIHLYALPDDGAARRLGAVAIEAPTMIHDFIATERHLVFFVSPVRFDLVRALLAIGASTDLLRWKPALGTEVLVVPIDQPDAVVRFPAEPFFQWHFANAFERGGEIVVDYVRYRGIESLSEVADGARAIDGHLHRAVVDPARGTLTSQRLVDVPCEFPRVHPRVEGAPHRHVWMTDGDLGTLLRHDVDGGGLVRHPLPAHQRASEPIFVPRAGATDEADGHVLSLCYDGERDRSFVAIYDGLRLGDGPVARLWLDHRVPITFHGTWAPAPAPPPGRQ